MRPDEETARQCSTSVPTSTQRAAEIDAQIRAAYASRSPEDEAEDVSWAEEGLAEWEAENRRTETEG